MRAVPVKYSSGPSTVPFGLAGDFHVQCLRIVGECRCGEHGDRDRHAHCLFGPHHSAPTKIAFALTNSLTPKPPCSFPYPEFFTPPKGIDGSATP